MLTTIQPSGLRGIMQAAASKSSMQRACAAALLREGITIIRNPGHSNDDKAALGVIRDMGATVTEMEDGSFKVVSRGMGPERREAGGAGSLVGAGGKPEVGGKASAGGSGRLEVNCGESGLGIRMFAPIIAMSDQPITVKGEGSLLSRPMDFFDEIFPQLGIRVVSQKGRLPLEIQGPLQARTIGIDGSLSSQFLTGLLLAYAASGAEGVSIKVNNLKSRPYIDLTLQVMRHFGWQVENRDYAEFYFPAAGKEVSGAGGAPISGDAGKLSSGAAKLSSDAAASQPEIRNQNSGSTGITEANERNYERSKLETIEYTVEGDWSGAAFLLVAGAIAGPVTIKGLAISSTQADKAILQALRDCGASLVVREGAIEIGPQATTGGGLESAGKAGGEAGGKAGGAGEKAGDIGRTVRDGSLDKAFAGKAFQFDATDCPDLFPPLVALASFCKGTTVIRGVSRLAHKESNRALTLQDEFGKMGVSIILQDDLMLIEGGEAVKGAVVHSRHDHRIAMACAVAGLRADGATTIEEAQAINKSYPDFYAHLQRLGAVVTIEEAVKKY